MTSEGQGFTATEKYLKALCDKTFLSLWSYTNVFRQTGSELCDLLVVVGNDIIIFSDKQCKYPNSEDSQINWKRWFRRAVSDSAKQLWGAEQWIKRNPQRIFIDNKCEKPLPVSIVITSKTKFHLMLVAHGASSACADTYGGIGSLMFSNEINGISNHTEPFVIGDLNLNQTFIHVLDDTTLDILLNNRDTISDFTAYLSKREAFLRSDLTIFSAGEEEFLAHYLKCLNAEGEHDFVLPEDIEPLSELSFDQGIWQNFQKSRKRYEQLEADKVSYMWDKIIEEFCKHAISGTQHYVSEGGFLDSEKAIRYLALETRLRRRFLSNRLLEMFKKTPSNIRMIRVLLPTNLNNVYYAFLLFPCYQPELDFSYEDYRIVRRNFLESICLVVRLKFPDAKHVIGLAMESGNHYTNRSEDLICFDCSCWNEDFEKVAIQDQLELGILKSPIKFEATEKEYPD